MATLLAVLVVYWKRVWQLVSGALNGGRDEWRYVGLLLIGTIPAAVVGLLFEDWVGRAFDSLVAVGASFIVTAVILWTTRWARIGRASEPSLMGAAGIGVAQAM